MAGTNKVLKINQPLFKAGDPPTGMYIVRSGELKVFIEKEGREIVLAKVGPGAVVGEMAFFESKPRSASVCSAGDCEVTLVSREDFDKLLKQIPKWFVSLMQSLSGRLRQTNDRLAALEASNSKSAGSVDQIKNILRILNVLTLVWHKDGSKDGKDWVVEKEKSIDSVSKILDVTKDSVLKILNVFVSARFFIEKKNQYNATILSSSSLGAFDKFIQLFQEMAAQGQNVTFFPKDSLPLLKIFKKFIVESPYDPVTIPFEQIVEVGQKQGLHTGTWNDSLKIFADPKSTVKSVKMDGNKVGLKSTKKDIDWFITVNEALTGLFS